MPLFPIALYTTAIGLFIGTALLVLRKNVVNPSRRRSPLAIPLKSGGVRAPRSSPRDRGAHPCNAPCDPSRK